MPRDRDLDVFVPAKLALLGELEAETAKVDPALLKQLAADVAVLGPEAMAAAVEVHRLGSEAMAAAVEVHRLGPEAVAEIMASKERPGVEEAFALYEAYRASADPGCRLIADWIDGLTLLEVLAIKPRLKEPPKKPGPKGPRADLVRFEAQAVENLAAGGDPNPSVRAISLEAARLRQVAEPNREIDPEHERRRLTRRKAHTGT